MNLLLLELHSLNSNYCIYNAYKRFLLYAYLVFSMKIIKFA